MDPITALILGLIQGLTEFLPISSSGHLELIKVIFQNKLIPEESLLFTIILHGATALSTLVMGEEEAITVCLLPGNVGLQYMVLGRLGIFVVMFLFHFCDLTFDHPIRSHGHGERPRSVPSGTVRLRL